VRVAATDPLNLVGILSPGPRVPALASNAVLYRDGVPLASKEAGQLVLRSAPPAGWQVGADLELEPAVEVADAAHSPSDAVAMRQPARYSPAP
jgi:ATP-dependent Lhr-like helicase